MARTIKVLGIYGSLRQASFNKAALRVAGEQLPADMVLELADISQFPLYNEDVREKGFPAPVQAFRDQIKAADALLFSAAEYNFSVSGVLKNAIDWASRPPDQPFDDKPVAIMGAAAGALGTGRAQYELRKICVFLNMHPLNKPEVFISAAHTKFDVAGKLTDEPMRGFIKQLMAALDVWTRRLKG
jgi:chromate reductase